MATIYVETNALEVSQELGLKAKRLSQVVKDIAKDLANRIHLDYQRTASSWSHRPKFEMITETRGDTVSVLAGTDDLIYKFVDLGTRPHDIFPKGNYPLRFQWGGHGSYRAKTKPGVLGSGGGGPSGPMVARMYVHHPGTQARRFTETIQAKYNRMADEIARTHILDWQQSA
jgi:hypothetical protein